MTKFWAGMTEERRVRCRYGEIPAASAGMTKGATEGGGDDGILGGGMTEERRVRCRYGEIPAASAGMTKGAAGMTGLWVGVVR